MGRACCFLVSFDDVAREEIEILGKQKPKFSFLA